MPLLVEFAHRLPVLLHVSLRILRVGLRLVGKLREHPFQQMIHLLLRVILHQLQLHPQRQRAGVNGLHMRGDCRIHRRPLQPRIPAQPPRLRADVVHHQIHLHILRLDGPPRLHRLPETVAVLLFHMPLHLTQQALEPIRDPPHRLPLPGPSRAPLTRQSRLVAERLRGLQREIQRPVRRRQPPGSGKNSAFRPREMIDGCRLHNANGKQTTRERGSFQLGLGFWLFTVEIGFHPRPGLLKLFRSEIAHLRPRERLAAGRHPSVPRLLPDDRHALHAVKVTLRSSGCPPTAPSHPSRGNPAA